MLHAVIRGSGQTVILLHSTGLSSRQWGFLANQLEKTHRVIAVDLPGYGKNPPFDDTRPYVIADELAEIVALFPEEPVHLVGHSYGGFLALQLARRLPERVRSVAVYDAVAFGALYAPDDSEGLADLASIDAPQFRDPATGGDANWLRAFVDYWNRGPAWDVLPQSSRDAFVSVGRKAFREVMEVTDDRTSAKEYGAIRAPALIMVGERSPAAARRVGVRLAESLPNARLLVVPGGTHMSPVTDGAPINRAFAEHVVANS